MILRSQREVRHQISISQPSPPRPPSLPRVQKPPRLEKAKLTYYNLKRFEQEITNPRKTRKSGSGKSTVTDTTTSPNRSKTTTTTTTDKKFGERLRENGVFFEWPDAQPPKDLTTIEEYLDAERDSQSVTEDDYQKYLHRIKIAENEDTILTGVWPCLAKEYDGRDHFGYGQNTNYQWTEVESAVTANISDPKPDISESFRHNQYPPEAVEALGPALAPTAYSVAMPKFCVELKGPDGLMPCATKQAAYDGAVMVDAGWEAHQCMSQPADMFLGNTQALTGAFNGAYLHIYASHAVAPQAEATNQAIAPQAETTKHEESSGVTPYPEKLNFHHYQLKAVTPSASLKNFKEARKNIRNAQDWAREKAIQNKNALHAHFHAMNAATAAAVPILAVKPTPLHSSSSPTYKERQGKQKMAEQDDR